MGGRLIRFLGVGATCYFVQLALLHVLQRSVEVYLADVCAYLLSAQLNFALSQLFTWGDRHGAEHILLRWIKFNISALVSVTLVNAAVLWILVQLDFPFWAAMLTANALTALFTFAANNLVVFRAAIVPPPALEGTSL